MKFKNLYVYLALVITLPAHADLVLSGSPSIVDRTELNKNYTALAKLLSKELGEPVHYVAPVSCQDYPQALRKGQYDLIVDGPHAAAWRIAKGLHKPVAEAQATLDYLVVVPASNTTIHSAEQLINRAVCVKASPTLSTLIFLEQFPNPMQQPDLRMFDDQARKPQKLLSGECDAAVLPASVYQNKFDQATQAKLRVVYKLAPLPGYVLTASDKLSAEKRNALAKHLSTANPASDPLLQALNKVGVNGDDPSKAIWTEVKPDALKGFEKVLSQNTYGWN
jgi:ABC-type phosphate/phosphonate transport system substrate-binding protein